MSKKLHISLIFSNLVEFKKLIFYFLRVNGRNMSVNQRVFSIVIGAVRLHDSVLEFLTSRRELPSGMDIFPNSSSYGFQLR